MEFFVFAVDRWFPRILLQAPNSEVFFEMTDIDVLGDLVVARLDIIKNSGDGHKWYRDKELIGLFDRLYKCGCITLPSDPVDRIRWVALACVLFAKQREFNYGSTITPHDYVSDDELEQYVGWGHHLIQKTRKFHVELKEKGWNSLL